jgi:uncharacterized protein YndB with AHSA1/START domain
MRSSAPSDSTRRRSKARPAGWATTAGSGTRASIGSTREYGEFQNRITYREVVAPERLVYTHDSGVDNDPAAFEVTITFAAEGTKTKLTMHSVLPSAAELERVKGFGAVEGGRQTLDRLEQWGTRS